MEKKMTAVQWLINELTLIDRRSLGDVLKLHEQALALERGQIEEAVMFGDCRGRNTQYLTASEYYTQTYLKPLKDKL